MNHKIRRGLEPNISKYSEIEQKYISLFANKLKKRGYPLEQITRVELKDSIDQERQFYAYNEVYFFINPSVHYKGDRSAGFQDLGLSWTIQPLFDILMEAWNLRLV